MLTQPERVHKQERQGLEREWRTTKQGGKTWEVELDNESGPLRADLQIYKLKSGMIDLESSI